VKSDRTRRESLALLAGASALGLSPQVSQAPAQATFRHGVASGDPGATSVVIWTRVTTSDETANPEVRWRDSAHRGYVRVTLDRQSATADFVAVQTDRPSGYATSVLRRERIARRNGALRFESDQGR
jgi:alkaline phosphatase D